MILVIDVETSGLLIKDKPLDSPEQPRIVQLAYVVQDSHRNSVHEYSSLMRPPETNGWSISKQATAVHNKTTEMCSRYGVHPKVALLDFASALETVRLIVGFNLPFDLGLLKREIDLLDQPYREQIMLRLERPRLRRIDCMKIATTLTKDGKYPSLARTYQMLTGTPYESTHDALDDAKATARVFYELVDRRLCEL